MGWKNTPQQRQRLEKAIGIMAITIIPIAVSVHTVVSYVFSMTLRPGWDSTVFGVYFVIGAIFSGIASILIVMAIFRKVYHLEEYVTEKHFRNLGYLLLTSLLIYLYLTIGEYLTVGYKLRIDEKNLLTLLMLGKNALWFWFFVIAGMAIPAALLIVRWGRVIPRIVAAAVLVNVDSHLGGVGGYSGCLCRLHVDLHHLCQGYASDIHLGGGRRVCRSRRAGTS
jgi:molybdopterin-containing oxidoreductase family membrane subunit